MKYIIYLTTRQDRETGEISQNAFRDKQKAIFAQYVSYADTHKEIGIGLGLYGSRKIIESHHGKIYVKSFPENRNIFGFKIPINQS